jgi:hypothetical protein
MSNKKQLNEIEKIVPETRTIKDRHGNDIELNPFTLGLELKVTGILLRNLDTKENATWEKILLDLFSSDKGEKIIVEIMSIMTNKDDEWILNDLESSEVMEVLLHFFVPRMTKLTAMINKFAETIGSPA